MARRRRRFRAAFVDVAKVVTAFTLAHSITLTLAALSIVALPSRWVESAIALSVVLAALNNLFPVVAQRPLDRRVRLRPAARLRLRRCAARTSACRRARSRCRWSASTSASKPGSSRSSSLFLPLAFALRSTWTYRRLVFGGGSVAIAAIASVWLVERAFDVGVFSALAAR